MLELIGILEETLCCSYFSLSYFYVELPMHCDYPDYLQLEILELMHCLVKMNIPIFGNKCFM